MRYGALVLLLSCFVAGCQTAPTDNEPSPDLAAYLELCREVAVGDEPDAARNDDWMVGAGLTTWERNATYRIVFADARHLSFRAEEYAYNGGAHGGTRITVGTLDRATGRWLTVADVIPPEKRAEALKQLYAGVVAKIGGREQLQGEVTLTENFYVARDGIHFVFNEYEVACYAAGSVEVVVK